MKFSCCSYWIISLLALLAVSRGEEGTCPAGSSCRRSKSCPEGWPLEQCLGTGPLATGEAKIISEDDEKIIWEAGMAGHSHYSLSASRTAVLVIDPQRVYSACPEQCEDCPLNYNLANLIAAPGSEGYSNQSPLCCEKFAEASVNINKITKQARAVGAPVFMIAHMYREGEDSFGRIEDFDVLGWAGWPMAYNLWHESLPYSDMMYTSEGADVGVEVDFNKDFYTEKTTYSSMTQPVVEKLRALGVDTVVVTGFMANYCVVTTSRMAHDLGFKVVYVQDAADGPVLLQLLSEVDENKAIPFYLGVSVADVTDTEDVVARLGSA